jgi:flagellar biogenesis protein FliO
VGVVEQQPLVVAENDTHVTAAVESLTVATDAARPLADEPDAPAGPSLGAVAAALLLLGATAWYLLRKTKAMRKGTAGQQRVIRTVGSHLLGPKHALLLVEVAGELVLLTTNEKGVQLLTKIDPAHAADAARRLAEEVPAAVASGTPAGTLADRFGRMFSKAWAAQRKGDDVSADALERGFFDRADEAVRRAGEEDALAALAGDTADDVRLAAPMPRVGRTPARARAASLRPAPAPAPASPLRGEGGEPLTSDILEKIRQLQSA